VHYSIGAAQIVPRVKVREERIDVERAKWELQDAVLVPGGEDNNLRSSIRIGIIKEIRIILTRTRIIVARIVVHSPV
jgi:hypothetical protein